MLSIIGSLIGMFCCAFGDDDAVRPRDVLEYWFGQVHAVDDYPKDKAKIWFMKDPAIDKEIAERFGGAVDAAGKGHLDHWKQTPEGRVALVVLLDQFPRNIYRNDPRAFAYDDQALALVLESIAAGEDKGLHPLYRAFLYVPLQHIERQEIQDLAVEKFHELVDDVPEHVRDNYKGYASYAIAHRDIIARFDRFPHRNAILNRPSTDEEQAFLKEPGSSF